MRPVFCDWVPVPVTELPNESKRWLTLYLSRSSSAKRALCCFDHILGPACCLRLRLGLGLLLCRPSLAHSFGRRLSLSGREFPTFFLCRFRSGGSGSDQRILWWSSPALRPLEGFDSSIQLVSFRNQKCDDMFRRHRENRSTDKSGSLTDQP